MNDTKKTLRDVLLEDIDTYESLSDGYKHKTCKLMRAVIETADVDNGLADLDDKTNYLNWPIDSLCGYTIYAEIKRVCMIAEMWDSNAIEHLAAAVCAQNCIIAYG